MKKNRDLFIHTSLYSLFLYTLINEKWTKSDYVLSTRIPYVVHKSLKENFGCKVYSYPIGWSKNVFKRIWRVNRDYFRYKCSFTDDYYDCVWGNDEFMASAPFRRQGMILVEDGSFNSESKNNTKRRQFHNNGFYLNFWTNWLFRNYISYGWSRHVKKIYYTENICLPPVIAHKGVQLNLQEVWDKLEKSQKEAILKLFGISSELMGHLNEYTTVLLTQSLPIPDKDKIAIYRKMTEGMDMSKVLIKTHYAETTDYVREFPQAAVVSMPIPMQLFSLIGYNPNKVMTISSGAITPFIKDGVEIIFLGTECDSRIAAKYGIITKETYMSNQKK